MVPRALPCALLTQHLCEPGALCGARDAEESSHGWSPRKGRLLQAQGLRCFGAFHGGRRLKLLSRWLVEEEFVKLVPCAVLGHNTETEHCPQGTPSLLGTQVGKEGVNSACDKG